MDHPSAFEAKLITAAGGLLNLAGHFIAIILATVIMIVIVINGNDNNSDDNNNSIKMIQW